MQTRLIHWAIPLVDNFCSSFVHEEISLRIPRTLDDHIFCLRLSLSSTYAGVMVTKVSPLPSALSSHWWQANVYFLPWDGTSITTSSRNQPAPIFVPSCPMVIFWICHKKKYPISINRGIGRTYVSRRGSCKKFALHYWLFLFSHVISILEIFLDHILYRIRLFCLYNFSLNISSSFNGLIYHYFRSTPSLACFLFYYTMLHTF